MLHDHIVTQPVTLVPVLPVVHVMIEALFVESIHVDTVPTQQKMKKLMSKHQLFLVNELNCKGLLLMLTKENVR